MMSAARLATLGIVLPAVRSADLLFISGLSSTDAGGNLITGKVGVDYTAEEAQGFARLVGLNLLAVMQAQLGDLDRVERIVKVLGLVNATPDFTRHPFAIDGCSTLFVSVFPDMGGHARTSMGASSLPNNIPVEIEAIVHVRNS